MPENKAYQDMFSFNLKLNRIETIIDEIDEAKQYDSGPLQELRVIVAESKGKVNAMCEAVMGQREWVL